MTDAELIDRIAAYIHLNCTLHVGNWQGCIACKKDAAEILTIVRKGSK